MKNLQRLLKTGKPWLAADEIRSILKLGPQAAAVFCSRAAARGDLARLKRGIYLIPGRLESASMEEQFVLSNLLQTPSYVSLLTALSYFGISTQVPQLLCEGINPVRSVQYETQGFSFPFTKFPKKLFAGFKRERGFFIAEPEKAFLDTIYLASLGRYSVDWFSLDLSRLNKKKLRRFLKWFPKKTKRWLRQKMEDL